MTGERGGDFAAEFIDGSSEAVNEEVYNNALRNWAHPPEKPEESGGWTSFFTRRNVRKAAVGDAGAVAGFLVGITGEANFTPNDGSDFSNAFIVAQCVGMVVYVGFQVARL